MRLKNGWYILNYHDINWEENPYISGIGGTFAPDIFQDHLKYLDSIAQLVSIDEGYKALKSSNIDRVMISFWFDDGFSGVRKYAKPMLDEYNISAGFSINSQFMLKKQLFWRSKLSYISYVDGLRFLRSRLKKYGYTINTSVKSFVMDNFSLDIIKEIDEVYSIFCNKIHQKDAFRIFEDINGVKELLNAGWEIANHSSNHYPISENSYINHFVKEFMECERDIKKSLGIDSRFWVVPFDRKSVDTTKLLSLTPDNRDLVLVGDRINTTYNRVIYRIEPPYLKGKELIKFINKLSQK